MELLFLAILIGLAHGLARLASGYPVCLRPAWLGNPHPIGLPHSCGYLFAGNVDAYFAQGGPVRLAEFRRDQLPRHLLGGRARYPDRHSAVRVHGHHAAALEDRRRSVWSRWRSCSVRFRAVWASRSSSLARLLAATTGILGATVVAMGLISLPAMLRNNYSQSLATGTIAASGTLGQIIPPSIVLIILADQLASAVDQAAPHARRSTRKRPATSRCRRSSASSRPAPARCSWVRSCPGLSWSACICCSF